MGERVSLCFSPPGRETQDGVSLLSPAADATFGGGEAGDLRSIERSILSAQGMWSNCDLYVQLPAAWFAANPILRIYARTGNLRAKVAEVAVGSLPQDPDSAIRTIALRVRGTPCEAFEVYGRTATTLTDGSFALQCWGTESTPERVGGLTIDGLDDAAAPARASFMLGQSGGRWEPFTISPSGEVYVVGTTTPSDNMPTPTDAIGVAGYSLGWSQGNVRWERIQLSTNGEQFVAGRETPAEGDANPTNAVPVQGYGMVWNGATWDRMASQVPGDSQANPTKGILSVLAKCQFWTGSDWRRLYGIGNTGIAAGATGAVNVAAYQFGWDGSAHRPSRCDSNGNLKTTAATPEVTNNTGGPSKILITKSAANLADNVKASAARVLSLDLYNEGTLQYLQVHNKASAPAAGEVPIFSWRVPASGRLTLGREFFGDEGCYLSAGLSLAWSSTAATYTATNLTGTVNGTYV